MRGDGIGEPLHDAAESKTLSMFGNSLRENRERQLVSVLQDSDEAAARNGQKTSPAVQG